MIMDYQIPEVLPYQFLKTVNITAVNRVKLDVNFRGRKLQCYQNVMSYLKSNLGDVQLGWTYSQLGNIVLKLTAHAVVKLPNGEYKCVTESEHDVSEIYFTPDNSISELIVNNRLPIKVYPLVQEPIVDKFVQLEQLQNKMRLEGNELAIKCIMNEKYLISKQLIEVAEIYE